MHRISRAAEMNLPVVAEVARFWPGNQSLAEISYGMFSYAARLALLMALFLLATGGLRAEEIGFIEEFSLAKDREAALKQLIPGTEKYYYYHALHYQNTEQFDKVDDILRTWIKRYRVTVGVREIQNRQALLLYEKNPAQSLEYLRKKLGIQFNHQRDVVGRKPNLPTRLDAKRISQATLRAQAIKRYRNLQGFEDRALDRLVAVSLRPSQRRHLLERLQRPDYPNLARLVVDDLNHKHSRGFGSMGIHRSLLRTQLDACRKLKPELLNQTAFVNAYLTKLHPAGGVDCRDDPKACADYLDRLWGFVRQLSPAHNSLKAHVLYHRLVLDRSQGLYDKERLMTYLNLPRRVSYINPQLMKRETSRRYPANLSADFRSATLLLPVGNDEPLVRSYLHHFFVKETTYKPYEAVLRDVYLKHHFAETKIVNGLGEAEQWASMLPPDKYQALKDRIDIDFAQTKTRHFSADAPVSLDLDIKNVRKLIVKVYKINTLNYYREKGTEVRTDINLDGLVANEETTYTYSEPSLRRVRRHFEFPSLKAPGVYVIDLIGNGESSRAVIQKGNLRHLVRTSVAGHVFTVLDEQNRLVRNARIWLAGRQYTAEKDGTITIPFSNRPAQQKIVLSNGKFSSLASFYHASENYDLVAGIHVDRESLLKGKTAKVIIRSGLYLNNTPVTLSVLEDVRLKITSIDSDGITTTKEVPGLKLLEDRETIYAFQTPPRLKTIAFTLSATVKNLSQDKTVKLDVQQRFMLNRIDQTAKIEDLHFSQIDGVYVIDVLGRTGETKADRPVAIVIKHQDFRNRVHVTLKSDRKGRITLGPLEGIDHIAATGPQGETHHWTLRQDRHASAATRHAQVGEPIRLPTMGHSKTPQRNEISLLELRDGTFVADRFDAISIEHGMIVLSDLPAGDFDLLLKESGNRIRLRISAGVRRNGYVLGKKRALEIRADKPLQIEQIAVRDKVVRIQLQGADRFTRVHLLATRFRPAYSAYGDLARVRDASPYHVTYAPTLSNYVEGRNIGDEYRYIIERKYAKKFPGNMLRRPGLLLNPWAIRATDAGEQFATPRSEYGGYGIAAGGAMGRGATKDSESGHVDFSNLDFLASGSALLLNLKPDPQGVVVIKRSALGPHHYLQVVAVDPRQTVVRRVSLEEIKAAPLDLRLFKGLDPQAHFIEQKQASFVAAEDKFVLSNIGMSKFESYDSLASVYGLFATLSNNAKLAEFGFLLKWHAMEPDEKRKQYSKHACHELNFFVFKKDPKFFRAVVRPYLTHKKDKTFMDHWLLGDALAAYLEPWRHQQLNEVERILLSQRIRGEQPWTARDLADRFALIPPNVENANRFFLTALRGRAFDNHHRADDRKSQRPFVTSVVPVFPQPDAGNSPGKQATRNGPSSGEDDSLDFVDEVEVKEEELGDLAIRDSDLEKDRLVKNGKYFKEDAKKRKAIRQHYRKLDKTQEWAENNYYHLPIGKQNAKLIAVNGFWRDYAAHKVGTPFRSTRFAEASRNFTEMLFALSVLDLPAESREHKTTFADGKMTLSAAGPMILFHKQIKPARPLANKTPILVSQNFFQQNDRYRQVSGQRTDKFVSDEFVINVVYGCQIVVTNPTASRQKLDLLLQIPVGAIPLSGGQITRGLQVNLHPYRTQTVEYQFYFPIAGKAAHYPVHVAKNGELIAHAAPQMLRVVDQPSKLDRESWAFVSQQGTSADVLAYLQKHNLHQTNLERIAFRMSDKEFFQQVVTLLQRRHVYSHTLWSYAIKHDAAVAIKEYLQHADAFVSECGQFLESPLLAIDPVARKTYQQIEYSPLVNARAHPLGRRRQIVNKRLAAQYGRLLKTLSYRADLDDDDLMSVTYYLLLQDRVAEAIDFFARVDARHISTRLQYDYFTAYLDMYTESPQQARTIAKQYKDFPIARWRNAFAAVGAQLDEIAGAQSVVIDPRDRQQKQAQLADTQPHLDFSVEVKQVVLNYQNIDRVRVNYYLMDVELLFSRNPFEKQFAGQFSHIDPHSTGELALSTDQETVRFPLPEKLHASNVLIEIVGKGQAKTKAYYASDLTIQMIENYGQLRVTHEKSGRPLAKVYVKVYAQDKRGRIKFYKDGYTDLRGRFEYASLSTNELDNVQKFSVLVLSETHGAVVRSASPPKQ